MDCLPNSHFMIPDKDLYLLSTMRTNSRKPLTNLSREIHMPVSTIFEKLRKYEGPLIKRYTALIDFQKIGFEMKVRMILKCDRKRKEELRAYLLKHKNINSLERVSNYDFMIEVLFRNMGELQDFQDALENFGVTDRQDFFVLDDLKKEAFLCDKVLVGPFFNRSKDL